MSDNPKKPAGRQKDDAADLVALSDAPGVKTSIFAATLTSGAPVSQVHRQGVDASLRVDRNHQVFTEAQLALTAAKAANEDFGRALNELAEKTNASAATDAAAAAAQVAATNAHVAAKKAQAEDVAAKAAAKKTQAEKDAAVDCEKACTHEATIAYARLEAAATAAAAAAAAAAVSFHANQHRQGVDASLRADWNQQVFTEMELALAAAKAANEDFGRALNELAEKTNASAATDAAAAAAQVAATNAHVAAKKAQAEDVAAKAAAKKTQAEKNAAVDDKIACTDKAAVAYTRLVAAAAAASIRANQEQTFMQGPTGAFLPPPDTGNMQNDGEDDDDASSSTPKSPGTKALTSDNGVDDDNVDGATPSLFKITEALPRTAGARSAVHCIQKNDVLVVVPPPATGYVQDSVKDDGEASTIASTMSTSINNKTPKKKAPATGENGVDESDNGKNEVDDSGATSFLLTISEAMPMTAEARWEIKPKHERVDVKPDKKKGVTQKKAVVKNAAKATIALHYLEAVSETAKNAAKPTIAYYDVETVDKIGRTPKLTKPPRQLRLLDNVKAPSSCDAAMGADPLTVMGSIHGKSSCLLQTSA